MKTNLDLEARSPALKSANAVLSTAIAELEELKRERAELERRLSAGAGRSSLDDQAIRYLSGEAHEPVNLADRLRTLEQAIEVRERAIQIQRQKVSHLREVASAELCKDLAPEYQPIAQRLRVAAQAMLDAIIAEQDFVNELLRNDVAIDYLDRRVPPRRTKDLEVFLRQTEDSRSAASHADGVMR